MVLPSAAGLSGDAQAGCPVLPAHPSCTAAVLQRPSSVLPPLCGSPTCVPPDFTLQAVPVHLRRGWHRRFPEQGIASPAQRSSPGAAGTRRLSLHLGISSSVCRARGKGCTGGKKEFSFTPACMTYSHTLLAMLMKIVKILSDLVGHAAPREDQELLSFIKIHSYYLKHTL